MRKQGIRIALGLAMLFGAWFVGGRLPQFFHPSVAVQAQGFEPFSKTFTLPASSSAQYIPACTTIIANCIPNFKQVAHSVTWVYANSTPALRACGIMLDGSADNSIFQTFGANGNTEPLNSGSFPANGYFDYVRIKATACASSSLTITYTGYSTALPITNLASPALSNPYSFMSPTVIEASATPSVLIGFQCSNSSMTGAYVQIGVSPTLSLPALGGPDVLLCQLVPASGYYSYTGPPIFPVGHAALPQYWFAGASTSAGGNLAAGTFNTTPTAGGSLYVQADVGSLLTLPCGATVAITQVNGGSGTGGVTGISAAPSFGGVACAVASGIVTTGGTGSGATVAITALAGASVVSTPITCNFEINGTGPYYPFNPLSP